MSRLPSRTSFWGELSFVLLRVYRLKRLWTRRGAVHVRSLAWRLWSSGCCCNRQTARGGEIKNILGAPHARGWWHEVPADWFQWEDIISIPWRHRSERIAVCEARARNLALRARARVPSLHQQRFVHLLDSQTNLAQVAKGRTGSQQMTHVHRQSAAVSLAAGFREVESYTRSDKNPADKGSRNYEEWRRAPRAHTSSKAGAHEPRQAQGGLRPTP